ncbi:MAG: YifB family Mg chelatase-like AAA ATPase [Parasporobacterium sp.]|nr:YifB family Mg chelatase-like AAA ATPase [Parasporobacterium sp.]
MFCSVYSAAICGVEPQLVSVEVDVSGGLPAINMVGLPSSEVREAKERVVRAIENTGIEVPARRITINLSPANIRKNGSGFDLPIAAALLTALGLIDPEHVENTLFVGELSLDGTILPVNGILPIAVFAKEQGIQNMIIPEGNAFEGAYVPEVRVYTASSLYRLMKGLKEKSLSLVENADLELMLEEKYRKNRLDFRDVQGQEAAKRATQVAAAGFHNLLYVGPPGSGKSLMAARIPSIINRLSPQECLEVSKIYSVAGLLTDQSLIANRPFRAPHHSITTAALIGGSSSPRPGEVTLAHKGILFLDEAAEFKKDTIEVLRQPLEDKQVVINRVNYRAVFPADFMLVMASNPCKCGYYPDRNLCHCSEPEVQKYFGKIKGPVMDRIDICIAVEKVQVQDLNDRASEISSEIMRKGVETAKIMQGERFKNEPIDFNSQMNNEMIRKFCPLKEDAKKVLDLAYDTYHLSARGYYKIIKVARTISDMESSDEIRREHVLEAIGYRNPLAER